MNVAMSHYTDSFSASRAATKDWEHTIHVERTIFWRRFYQPIWILFLHLEVLKNKIEAPGYMQAFQEGNTTVLNAYRKARFTGPLFPHIDPLKEVKAEREKLGTRGAHIPLTTVEAATEVLNGGDSDNNMSQFAEEYKTAETLGIIPEPTAAEQASTENEAEE
jgi:capsid protein